MNDRPPNELPVRKAPPAARRAEAPPAGFNISRDDIYFVLFRRKWLIVAFAVIGIIAAALTYKLQPADYRSDAKLLVRYVLESKSADGASADNQMKSPDSRGDNIINSEIEILTSLDVCEQAAIAVGLDKVLQRPSTTNESIAAGAVIRGGLSVDAPRKSNVMKLRLQHRDPEVASRGLSQLVDAYLRRHVEIHRGIGAMENVLSQQRDLFRTRLADTERALRQYKTNFVGMTLAEARKSLTEQFSRIRQEILVAEAELAETLATNDLWQASTVPATNATAAASTNEVSQVAVAPPYTVGEYRSLCSRLDGLRTRELDLLGQYTEENTLVKRTREQIIETEVRKRLLEGEFPSLLRIETATRGPGGTTLPAGPNRSRLAGVHARISVLTNQLGSMKAEISSLDNIEDDIQRLQRARELAEKNYRYYDAGIEQAVFDEALAGGKLANISVIQTPTPPIRDGDLRRKIAMGVMAAGILGGLALAFLLELFVDRTLKRPGEVEERLHVPLFQSIPRLALTASEPRGTRAAAALPDHGGPGPNASAPGSLPALWSPGHALRSYFQGLRDRVLFHFDGIVRKPKLLGVTGCAQGSGVTTTAVGLAAALSETGGGSVLLVDLNLDQHAAHPFFHGRPGCGLADAIENETREGGLVSDNLYLAHARNAPGTSESLPQRLAQLVPRLRLSDYDYIVFDMPRVTHTGITARVAGMMDLVLLVAEAEKDQREVLERALGLLKACGANVGGVLNKVEMYVPRRLRSHYYETSTAP